jgi:hypothetical protein
MQIKVTIMGNCSRHCSNPFTISSLSLAATPDAKLPTGQWHPSKVCPHLSTHFPVPVIEETRKFAKPKALRWCWKDALESGAELILVQIARSDT